MIAWLLANTLTAALFAGLVWAVIRVARPAPGVRHALWLIVLFKLVSPVEFLWSVPVAALPAPVEETSTPVVSMTLPPDPVYGLVTEELIEVPLGENAVPVLSPMTPLIEETVALPTVTETMPVARLEPDRRWEWWLLFIWMAGGALMLSRLTRDTWRFGRFARLAKKAPDTLVSEVAVVANRMGLRMPAVRLLSGLTSPVMWCVGRPVLLWPAELENQVSGEGRRAVIAHELAHLRRRDHWVRWLEMLAAVVHWWNPVFWLARRRLRADAELACDQWATTQADRRTYAEALLAVCVFQPRRRPAAAVGVLGEGRRDMQERLTQIMRMTTPSRAAFAAKLCVVLFGLAAIPALTLGQAPAKPEPAKAPVVPDGSAVEVRDYVVEVTAKDPEIALLQEQIKALTAKMEALREVKKLSDLKANLLNQARAAEQQVTAEKHAETARQYLLKQQNAAQAQWKDGDKKDPATPQDALYSRMRILLGEKPAEKQTVVAGTNGVKVFGPDGKEIPGVIVVIEPSGKALTLPAPVTKPLPPTAPLPPMVPLPPPTVQPQVAPPRPAPPAPVEAPRYRVTEVRSYPPAAPGTITLSRGTYKLPKDQALALAALLSGVKQVVMEIKVDGDTVVVTTTPEAQQVIQGLVRMLTGDKSFGQTLKLGAHTAPDTGANHGLLYLNQLFPNTFVPSDPTKDSVWATTTKPLPLKVNLNTVSPSSGAVPYPPTNVQGTITIDTSKSPAPAKPTPAAPKQ